MAGKAGKRSKPKAKPKAPTPRKSSRRTGVTSPRSLDAAERRRYVLALRKSGATYETIANQVIARFGPDVTPEGYDERYAYKDVMRELAKIKDEITEDAYSVRTLELERIDRMFSEMYRQALQGIVGAVDRCVLLQKQRERYIPGLKVPEQLEVAGPGGGPIKVTEVIIDATGDDGEP